MQRSWVTSIYDLDLIATLLMPLPFIVAVISRRFTAAVVYAIIIVGLNMIVLIAGKIAHLTWREYLRNLKADR